MTTWFKDANMKILQYNTILKLAADLPHTLRIVDVDRVMNAANEEGCLEDFRKWLWIHLNMSRFNHDKRIQRLKAKVRDWEPDAKSQDSLNTTASF